MMEEAKGRFPADLDYAVSLATTRALFLKPRKEAAGPLGAFFRLFNRVFSRAVNGYTVNPAGQIGSEPVPPGQEFTYAVRLFFLCWCWFKRLCSRGSFNRFR